MTEPKKLEQACLEILRAIGEDPKRAGLLRTPARFQEAMQDLTSGYNQSVDEIVNGAIYEESHSEIILIRNIEFYSLCEHHILPFFGHAHVAYIPNGKIIGLSKIPRIVQMFARRLQVQERLTEQVCEALVELIKPLGVACIMEASHLCMMMRGVQVQSSSMITSSMRGVFLDRDRTRAELLQLIHNRRS